MTYEILADIRRRDRLARIKTRKDEYRRLRNEIVSKIRKAEREYLQEQIENSIGDIKKHWNVISVILEKVDRFLEGPASSSSSSPA